MTVNEKLLDASIAHQIDLTYYSNNVVSRIIAILKKTDSEIVTQLQIALERLPSSSFTVERLDLILTAVRSLNSQAYAELSGLINKELADLVEYEITHQKQLFDNLLPVQVSTTTVNIEQVYAAALARPFQGKLLKEFMQGLETDKAVRIRDAIRMGYIEGQTISQIVQRVRGTKTLLYKDGIIEINKRNAEAVVRTAIGHTAAFAKDKFLEANNEIIKALKWHSTLDGRTSEICRARDGKLYTLKHVPIKHNLQWLGGPGNAHWNCRSSKTAVVKSWQELGFDISEMPASDRASMDGGVPADTTYGEWLKGKPASFQDDVLGKAKGKLFRSGLDIEQFSNNKGKSYTLKELRERDTSYFVKAGL